MSKQVCVYLILIVQFLLHNTLHANEHNGYLLVMKPINDRSEMALRNQLQTRLTSSLSHLGTHSKLSLSFKQVIHLRPYSPLNSEQLELLKNLPQVQSIEPNTIYFPHSEPAKDLWKNQWGFHNTGNNNWAKGPAGEDISALKAWSLHRGSADIVIAIIDSGVDLEHEDIAPNLFVNHAEKNGLPGVDDDENGYVDDIHGYDFAHDDPIPEDALGHGTHVAGLIGAAHNQTGISGVMNQVKLLPLKFITKERKGDLKNALLAIDYAITMKAHIINNSWGTDSKSELLVQAIQAAHDAKIFFVCSAGNRKNNNDSNPVYPASVASPNVISVGATNGRGDKASFSNFGPTSVHILAPGTMIVSSDINEKTYKWRSGTSMSAPLVSGAIGLLLSYERNIRYDEVLPRLIRTSDYGKKHKLWSQGGRLNLHRLLADLPGAQTPEIKGPKIKTLNPQEITLNSFSGG